MPIPDQWGQIIREQKVVKLFLIGQRFFVLREGVGNQSINIVKLQYWVRASWSEPYTLATWLKTCLICFSQNAWLWLVLEGALEGSTSITGSGGASFTETGGSGFSWGGGEAAGGGVWSAGLACGRGESWEVGIASAFFTLSSWCLNLDKGSKMNVCRGSPLLLLILVFSEEPWWTKAEEDWCAEGFVSSFAWCLALWNVWPQNYTFCSFSVFCAAAQRC